MHNTTIIDTYAKIASISLTFSEIYINNATFIGNFAEVASNGLSMIFSYCHMENSLIDNSRNEISINSSTIENVQTGFLNMNYQSHFIANNTIFKNIKGTSGGFLYSTG